MSIKEIKLRDQAEGGYVRRFHVFADDAWEAMNNVGAMLRKAGRGGYSLSATPTTPFCFIVDATAMPANIDDLTIDEQLGGYRGRGMKRERA